MIPGKTKQNILVALGVIAGLLVGLMAGARIGGGSTEKIMRQASSTEFLGLMSRMAVHHADKEKATELFEEGIDNYIESFHQNIVRNASFRNDPQVVQAMQIAKVYRRNYPPTPRMSKQVNQALESVTPLRGDDPWVNAKCNGALCQLIRSEAKEAPKEQR